MKSLLFILFTAVVVIGCTTTKQPGRTEFASTDNTTQLLNPIETGSIITGKQAQIYINNYREIYSNRALIKRVGSVFKKRQMTKAIWFNQKFISDLDSMLERNDISTNNPTTDTGRIDGIRIYLGAYDDKLPDGITSDHQNPISLFWVATRDRSARDSSAYHADDINYFKPLLKLQKLKNGNTRRKDIANHGQLCPDNCKGAKFN